MRYALALMLGVTLVGVAYAQSAGGWRLDERFATMKMAIIDIERAESKATHAFIRCYRGKQLDAVVIVGPQLAGRMAPVRYRFDDGEWQRGTWQTTAGGDGAFADDTRAFAQQLVAHARLSFEAQGDDGVMHAVEIPLQGARAPIEHVLAACGG